MTTSARIDIRRILCPTDFSASSARAFEHEQSLRADLATLMTPARRAGLHVAADLREGKPASEIVQVAGELPADLVVMGTHGRGGLAQEREAGLIVMGVHGRGRLDPLAFGSATHQVVREATCPVLTVRPTGR